MPRGHGTDPAVDGTVHPQKGGNVHPVARHLDVDLQLVAEAGQVRNVLPRSEVSTEEQDQRAWTDSRLQ